MEEAKKHDQFSTIICAPLYSEELTTSTTKATTCANTDNNEYVCVNIERFKLKLFR